MNHSFIDEHSHIDSLLSRLDPRTKIIGFFVFLIFIVLTAAESSLSFILYALLLFALVVLSRIPVAYILKRCLIAVPFILMTAIFLLFGGQGEKVASITAGGFRINIYAASWLMFQGVMFKGILSIVCMTLLTASTPFPQLLAALEYLKIPRLITMILSFMYRYVFLIEDEAMKMWRAMKARNAGSSRRLHLRAMANMLGILFIRSFERGETVYLAMCSRGFDGTVNRLPNCGLKKMDMAFLLNIFCVLISINLLDNVLGK